MRPGSSLAVFLVQCLVSLQWYHYGLACNASQPVELYTYQVVTEYPHDPDAFTQGLQYDRICDPKCRDVFWESTGLRGRSSVRLVEVATGTVISKRALAQQWFGEGLTRFGNQLYQITWQGPTGFQYAANSSLTPVREFKTPLADGWGITNDGRQLILSDGSSRLTWVNPATMAAVRSVEVKDGNQTIKLLNELEYINGEVWANVWQTECIARICPTTGRVQGWVLMHGLKAALQARGLPQSSGMDVLNGIAYDVAGKRLFVTGKLWPRVFVVKLTKVPAVKVATGKKMRQQRQSCYVS